MKVQKTISLTPGTLSIALQMENFSGWIRARLRQYSEGVDPVEMELSKDHYQLMFKTLSAAVHSCFPHSADFTAQDVFLRFNEMVNQRRLEDFE